MNKRIWIGLGRFFLPIPRTLWFPILTRMAKRTFSHGAELSSNQRRVRNFAVTEIAKTGRPIEPIRFAEELDLSLAEVSQILDELESGKTFVYRDSSGAVEWAYPVTAAKTPHQLKLDTGESISAA